MELKHIKYLQCIICGKKYSTEEIEYTCPDHENEGIVDVIYDYDYIRNTFKKNNLATSQDFSIWRYKPLLPILSNARVPPLKVGWTPLYNADRLASGLGLKKIWIKDDGRQPSASFKDRASAIAIIKAQEKKVKIITTASTGNAAAALSALCSSVNQSNAIFVPESAPQAKIVQLMVFGSLVFLVKGSYDDAYDLCMFAAKEFGWYNRSTGFNPYMTEGKKTVTFEICEQLCWRVPDRVFISVGDGCIVGGVYKGFKDLMELGWIDKMPKIMGVQAEGSDYLYQAWKNQEDVLTKPEINATTIADSISTGLPKDRLKAMIAIKKSSGAFIRVSDDEILLAITDLASGCGVFAEPAGAAAYAGLKRAMQLNLISKEESIVVINTGNGLKDIHSAMNATQKIGLKPNIVKADPHDLKNLLSKLNSKKGWVNNEISQ